MGGSGSTRWGDHRPKQLVEGTLRLDLLDPQLRPLLQDPARATWTITITRGLDRWSWRAYLSASGADGSRQLALCGVPHDSYEPGQVIHLAPVTAGFHERVLAACPSCQRRVQILHALPQEGVFRCRECLELGYLSTRQWDKRVARLAQAMLRADEAGHEADALH